MFIVIYSVYLVISISLTVWVARTLHHNGRVFLVDAFQGNTDLADSVNHLLAVGFYLVNIGYVALALRTDAKVDETRQAIELVCDKIGLVLVVLGIMHFTNLYVLNVMRKRSAHQPKPVKNAGWNGGDAPIGKVLD
jgi:hypothetical protein